MGAGLAGIAAEDAIAAVVPAEVGEGEEDLAGIGDNAWLEALFDLAGGGKQYRKFVFIYAK